MFKYFYINSFLFFCFLYPESGYSNNDYFDRDQFQSSHQNKKIQNKKNKNKENQIREIDHGIDEYFSVVKKVDHYELAHISKTRIQGYEAEVETLFNRNKWMRWGGYLAGAAAAAGLAYYSGVLSSVGSGLSASLGSLSSWFSSKKNADDQKVSQMSIKELQERLDENNKLIDRQNELNKQALMALSAHKIIEKAQEVEAQKAAQEKEKDSNIHAKAMAVKDAVGDVAGGVNKMLLGLPGDWVNKVVYGSFTGAGSALVLGGISYGVSSPLQKLYDTVYHEGDIIWYCKNQTTTLQTFKELIELAKIIASTQDDYEKTSSLESFVHLYQKLIMCYEQILGFMIYKHKKNINQPFVASGMNIVIRGIYNDVKDATNHLQNIVNDSTKSIGLSGMIEKIEQHLNKRIREYKQYEDFFDLPAVS